MKLDLYLLLFIPCDNYLVTLAWKLEITNRTFQNLLSLEIRELTFLNYIKFMDQRNVRL